MRQRPTLLVFKDVDTLRLQKKSYLIHVFLLPLAPSSSSSSLVKESAYSNAVSALRAQYAALLEHEQATAAAAADATAANDASDDADSNDNANATAAAAAAAFDLEAAMANGALYAGNCGVFGGKGVECENCVESGPMYGSSSSSSSSGSSSSK